MSDKQDKGASTEGMTRKQRRAAERDARSKGGSTKPASTAKRSGPSMLVISVGALIIGLVIVAALIVLSGGDDDDSPAVALSGEPPPAEELRDGRSLQVAGITPPVTIEAFEDAQCPACGLFTERIEPLIIAGPVADGTARFTYNDFAFLGPESFTAAAAMRVADELDGKFWDYHHALFFNQDGENRGSFSTERLADIAELVGLDREAFMTEMTEPKLSEWVALVEAETAVGRDMGVGSTPSLFINGQLISGVPNSWSELQDVINAAAADAEAAAEAGAVASEAPVEPELTQAPAAEATEMPAESAAAG